MSRKTASVEILMRDAESNITGVQTAYGYTDDDGATVVIDNGNAPDIEAAAPADITVTVIPPPVPLTPATLVSRVNDAEANTSTLTFTF
jgi:hypothetical protein